MSEQRTRTGRPGIWAGIECTINRVGDQYFDQLGYSGHYTRTGDIEKLAALGIEALRYPLLWERHQQTRDTIIDWSFAAKNLEAIRSKDITPIVGLVHHGSGPAWTNFYDGSFEEGLAGYALRVATEFPWIEYYTPVNEPLTTARFCGLYGHWYPHGHSDEVFARILLAECKGTVLAMKAIRTVNSAAKLVQTDDLGKVYSSPALQYQARFENERRWLAFDLMSGKVQPGHPMWTYLLWAGIDESELYFLLEHAVVPDIIGLNYYLTSERFIDDRLEHYPAHTHGGNGIHQYADVEAVRVAMSDEEETGAAHLLREAWQRYNLPLAITEAHLHCTREQQGRWLKYIWEITCDLKRNEGIDIRGVTAWAAFGSFGWNRLLTQPGGDYEPGIFDVRNGEARPTAIAAAIKVIAGGETIIHPVLHGAGWWELPSRVHYGAASIQLQQKLAKSTKPLIILGATGTLGKAFSHICNERGIQHLLWSRADLDITASPEDMIARLTAANGWGVINATGYVRVDDAENDAENCFTINTIGALNIAAACQKAGLKLACFSSDLVFDGEKGSAYVEDEATNPLNVYGRSKALAETKILEVSNSALVVRTSAFFGPWDAYNFVTVALRDLAAGKAFRAADDVVVSPAYLPDLINNCLDLMIDDACGIWHLANDSSVSWAAFAKMAARLAGLDEQLVIPVPQSEFGWKAVRPANTSLRSSNGVIMPSLEDALARYMRAEGAVAPYGNVLVPAGA